MVILFQLKGTLFQNESPKLTPYRDKNEKYFGDEDVLKNVPSLFGYGIVGILIPTFGS